MALVPETQHKATCHLCGKESLKFKATKVLINLSHANKDQLNESLVFQDVRSYSLKKSYNLDKNNCNWYELFIESKNY